MPEISVIVTTYNRELLLTKTVNAILNQTFKDFELIIVDNFSNYNFFKHIESFNDKRILPFQNHNNGIIAVNRNFGIKKAQGTFIAFCDDDDVWTSNKLFSCNKIINQEIDFVYHDMQIFTNNSLILRRVLRGRHLKSPVLIDLLVNGNYIIYTSVVIRKEILIQTKGFNESKDMIATEDYNAWLKVSEITEKFYYLPKTLGGYLVHDSGLSRKDISKNIENATLEFIGKLDHVQLKKYYSGIKYTEGRFKYLAEDFSNAKLNLQYSLKYGRNFEIRLKSAFMLLGCYLK